MEKMTPLGLIRAEDAIMEIAQRAEPALWADGVMAQDEADVWYGLNIDFDGVYLVEMLDALQAKGNYQNLRRRQASFFSAMAVLKEWLHSGNVSSCHFSPFRYIDLEAHLRTDPQNQGSEIEEGAFEHIQPVAIDRRSWKEANAVLLNGKLHDEKGADSTLFLDEKSFSRCLEDVVPNHAQENASCLDTYRTGAPGRPSPMFFVVQEFFRRRESGEVAKTLKAEAEALREWCLSKHPAIKSPTSKTIENKIRGDYRASDQTKPTQL